jgi:hypothetical protein
MLIWRKLKEILKLPDHRTRLDVAMTINFLVNLFARGRISEEKLREELIKILVEVLDFMHPEYTREELLNRAEALADDLIRAIKVDTITTRVASRL